MTSVRQPAPGRPYDALYGTFTSSTSRDHPQTPPRTPLNPERLTDNHPTLQTYTRRPGLHGVREQRPPSERAREPGGGEGAALR